MSQHQSRQRRAVAVGGLAVLERPTQLGQVRLQDLWHSPARDLLSSKGGGMARMHRWKGEPYWSQLPPE